MPSYPSPDTWESASSRQKDRVKRSFAELQRRDVPVYPGPLLVDDDETVTVQSPQDVARRTIVLWAVELRGEGESQEEAREIIDSLDLWTYVSPKEKQFLDMKDPDPEESQAFVWRLECLWVLTWALGYIDSLDWPSGMCDVSHLAELLSQVEGDPTFITGATLRPTSELLDAQDVTMRLQWAIRDALLHQGGSIPEDLDWSGSSEFVPVTMSGVTGVVAERHYVLNWLVNYLDPEGWDDVDTPT